MQFKGGKIPIYHYYITMALNTRRWIRIILPFKDQQYMS